MVSDLSISDVGDCALDPFDNCEQFHKKFKDKSIRATLAVLNDPNLQEDGRCYVFLNKALSFSTSKSKCEGAGGMLPWFPSPYIDTEKVNQVMEYFKETTRLRALKLWTGLVTEGNATAANWVWMCPNSKQSIKAETSSIKWSNASKAAHVEGFAGVIEYNRKGVIKSEEIYRYFHTVLCVGSSRNSNEGSMLKILLIVFLTIVILILLTWAIYIGYNKYFERSMKERDGDSKPEAMQINEPASQTAPRVNEPTESSNKCSESTESSSKAFESI